MTLIDERNNCSLQRAVKMRSRIQCLMDEMRIDVTDLDDPRAKALFETSAEVLKGLVAAFEHYEDRKEAAWV